MDNSFKIIAALVFTLLAGQVSYIPMVHAQSTIFANGFSGQTTPGIDLVPESGTDVRIHGDVNLLNNVISNLGLPKSEKDAATKDYVDEAAALSAALDARMPVAGKNYRLSIDAASFEGEYAIGVNFVGILNRDIRGTTLDYSIGSAFTTNEHMVKGSVGLSW